jgi:hypothetical protein
MAEGSIACKLKTAWDPQPHQLPSNPEECAAYRAQADAEPLQHLIKQEHKVWNEAVKGIPAYRPKERAQHAQRLQAYVAAAAARTGSQLDPGLKNELYEALGMTPCS